MSASEPRSSFRVAGGFARANPVPTTAQSCLSKALTTCLPSRPVAPVMRAVFAMVVVVRSLGAFRDRGVVDRELVDASVRQVVIFTFTRSRSRQHITV